MLADAARLDAATNERISGELNGLSGISHFELVYGIPNAHIIRAAFLHPGPFGSRFNDTTRGAWYAAKKVETSIAEVAYHKSKRLSEMVVPGLPYERPNEEVSTYATVFTSSIEQHIHSNSTFPKPFLTRAARTW